jgi:Asp-tRNA(Asn)/Glu-tRNA(Gln) amidotransferase A subunit family amidase
MLGNGPEHREVNELVEQALAVLAGLGAEIVDYRDTVDIHDLLANVNVQSYDQAAEITAYIQKFARHSPYRNFDELLASGKVVPWVVDNRLRKAAACSGNIAERDSRLRKMAEYRDRVMYMMVRQRLDVLVYPMQQQLVARIGESQAGRNGILAAVTGFPAITVPAGFSAATPTAPIGIPVGIEFFGRPFSERLLIRLAFAYEQATHNRKPPVSTPL